MNISQGPKTLICVQFDQNHWHLFFAFVVMLQNTEDRLLYVVHDDVEIDLIFLIALRVEGMPELNDVGVKEFLHYLELPVLIPFVLVHFFDRHFLIGFVHNGLEHDAEGAVSNYALRIIGVARGLLDLTLIFLHSIVNDFQ